MGRPQFGRSVESPSDEASRKDNVSSELGSATIADASSADALTFTNNTGELRQLQFASIAAGDGSDAAARADLQIKDSSGTIVHEIIGAVRQYPYILNPTLPIQDGWTVNVKVHNNDGVSKQYIVAAVHRGK